jgi:hypothetical protein
MVPVLVAITVGSGTACSSRGGVVSFRGTEFADGAGIGDSGLDVGFLQDLWQDFPNNVGDQLDVGVFVVSFLPFADKADQSGFDHVAPPPVA